MAANIKDFIIDVSEISEEKNINKSIKKNKPLCTYEVILENNTDFVVRRKTQKTDKDLVVIVSQDLFYIKDNKNEDIKKINEYNSKKIIGNFLKDYNGGIQFEKLSWSKNLSQSAICNLISNEGLRNLYKHGIEISYLENGKVQKISEFLKENPKLVRYFLAAIGDKKINYYIFITLDNVFSFYREFGFNNAKYLIDCLKDVNFIDKYNYMSYLTEVIKKHNLNIMSFVQYITYGFRKQGIDSLDSSIMRLYSDYLEMNRQIYGTVKEKYPKYLKTQHDMIQYKYNLWTIYKKDLLIFKHSKENEDLVYSYKDYCIVTPKTAQDLLDEAASNHNCLASYISRIAKGETFVVFLRRKEDPEETFLTVEVKDKKILQIEGYGNNYYFDNDVKEFIEKWAKEKELEIICRLKVNGGC